MTREEIRERASALLSSLDFAATGTRRGEETERHLLYLIRATLEEAARAVCSDCDHEVALEMFKKAGKTYWSHQSEKGDTARCDAGAIHDLIAALAALDAKADAKPGGGA